MLNAAAGIGTGTAGKPAGELEAQRAFRTSDSLHWEYWRGTRHQRFLLRAT